MKTIRNVALIKSLVRIQYEIGKLEFIELLGLHAKAVNPSSEIEITFNVFAELKQKLIDESEECIDLLVMECSKDKIDLSIKNLITTTLNTINLVTNMSNDLITPESLILKEFLINIVTKLTLKISDIADRCLELDSIFSDFEPFSDSTINSYDKERKIFELGFDLDTSFQENSYEVSSTLEISLKNLINKCLGDYSQSERLIQYEQNKSPDVTYEEAVNLAISRWELDNR